MVAVNSGQAAMIARQNINLSIVLFSRNCLNEASDVNGISDPEYIGVQIIGRPGNMDCTASNLSCTLLFSTQITGTAG